MCSAATSEERARAGAHALHEAKDLLSGNRRCSAGSPFCPRGKPPTSSLVNGSCYEEARADSLLGWVHFTAQMLSFRHLVGSFLLRDLSLGSTEKALEWHARFPAGLQGSRLRMDLLEDSHCRQPEVSMQQGGRVWGLPRWDRTQGHRVTHGGTAKEFLELVQQLYSSKCSARYPHPFWWGSLA